MPFRTNLFINVGTQLTISSRIHRKRNRTNPASGNARAPPLGPQPELRLLDRSSLDLLSMKPPKTVPCIVCT